MKCTNPWISAIWWRKLENKLTELSQRSWYLARPTWNLMVAMARQKWWTPNWHIKFLLRMKEQILVLKAHPLSHDCLYLNFLDELMISVQNSECSNCKVMLIYLFSAIPFIKNPEQNVTFEMYFQRAWQETFFLSLYNFLITMFHHMHILLK